MMTSPRSLLLMNDSLLSIRGKHSCRVINASMPKDYSESLISPETEYIVYMLHCLLFLPVLFIIGAPLNILNMIIFRKQGLGDRINVCLFSLAFLDLAYLTFIFVFNVACAYWRLKEDEYVDAAYRFSIDSGLIGLYGISYGPYFVSAIISTERCICVLFPLKARQCISTKALVMVIVTGVVILVVLRFVVLARLQVTCLFIQQTGEINWTISLSQFYFRNKALIDNLDSVFFGFVVVIGCLVVVIITTFTTAVKLQQVVHWRGQSSSSMSTKEIGIVKMILCLSVEFVILSIPKIVLRFSRLIDPQLSLAGVYFNLYNVLVYMAELSSYTNSIVNFFVYYFRSSRYRETLYNILHVKHAQKKRKQENTLGAAHS